MYQNYREISSPLQAIWDVLDNHLATTPSVFRMVLRCAAFLAVTALLIVPFVIAYGLDFARSKRAIAVVWFRACRRITSLSVTVKGEPCHHDGILYVANHVSYLDIIVLGQFLDARFVAKSEVADWPLFGFLARMSNTLFVTRDRRQSAKDGKQLEAAIAEGERLIMFPEGTSSNGREVLPFKSALFAAVDPNRVSHDIRIQPISIAYTHYADGRRLTGKLADLYAWYGEMTLFGHLMRVFGMKGAALEVQFLPAIHPSAFSDRKQLASATQHAVATSLMKSHQAR